MKVLRSLVRIVGGIVKALRLALPKLGVGWMFALLTISFNRVTIYELGVTAALVTTMLGLHYFLAPFQVIVGRFADRHPLLGWRRTPYLVGAACVSSLVFLALPSTAVAMGQGSILAVVVGFALFALFGISIAVMGDAHHALIAETTHEKTRGGVMAVVWTTLIISTIASAIVLRVRMPEYDQAAMQGVYNLTPFVVLGSVLLGVVGLEKRLRGDERTAALERARRAAPAGNPLRAASMVLRTNPHARGFFAFVLLAILGIFLQDNILEVFGGDVFGLTTGDTASFQVLWGGGVLASMLIMGLVSSVLPVSKKLLATLGGIGTACGLGLLATAALLGQQMLLNPALIVMGIGAGVFNVGALSMMMDMTVDGATGLYIGLWGIAQAFGNGLAAVISGSLRTMLIETKLLDANAGYAVIFGLELVIMVVAVALLRGVSVDGFKGLTRADLSRSMEVNAVA